MLRGGWIRQIQAVNVPALPVQIIATSKCFIHILHKDFHHLVIIHKNCISYYPSNLLRSDKTDS